MAVLTKGEALAQIFLLLKRRIFVIPVMLGMIRPISIGVSILANRPSRIAPTAR